MTDKKLTAVSYLIESMEKQVGRIDHVNNRIHIDVSFEDFMEMKKQAKALEREQMKERCIECYKAGFEENIRPKHEDAEQYYRETYESDYFTKNYGDNVNPDLQKP